MEINAHSKSKEEIFNELKTSEQGLTAEQAKQRLEKYGKNILKKTHKLRPFKIFIQQFNSFLIYILIFAAIVSFLINHLLDAIVISAIIVLNSLIGFFQQYKAEKAIKNLRKVLVPMSNVVRNNRFEVIPSSELVLGDIVVLNSGDKLNADCRIIESENLQTNEAILTGESLPIDKHSKKLLLDTILTERTNVLFTGTQIVRGTSKAVVIATGMNTAFGKIAGSLQDIEVQKTPMQKRLDNFSKQIGIFILIFVAFVGFLGITGKFDALTMFMTAIALAVSAIPEGLPAVLSLSFAISSLLMSKQNVIIRKLSAVESLGSVTVICSDKTGTITEEKMSVQEIFTNNKFYLKDKNNIFLGDKKILLNKNKELLQLFKISVLCNNARFELIDDKYVFFGEPTEEALLSASLEFGLNKKKMIEAEPSIRKFEFDSKRKLMSIARDNGRNYVLYSKGAVEKILSISKSELINGQIKPLTEKRKKEILESSKKMEHNALRVLAFAYKNFNKKDELEEKAMIFVGLVGMIDPPRKEVKNAIKQCKEAGIKIKIITGDSVATAVAIAKQIGIKGKTITGEELEKMSDADLLDSIDELVIFARTTPHQKLRITQILQQKQEIVAITGDGINDVLALKSADIGIAMGKRGTDVARDVSDIVLVNDNFASIVEGVKQGRKTYDNIKKFTKYFLAVNFSEIFLILIALILGMLYGQDKWFLPLLPLQILWINLITDSLPALSLVFENPEQVMKTPPRREKSILENIWRFIIIAGIFTFAIKFVMYLIGIGNNFSVELTRTMVLTTAILFELFFVYTFRSNESLIKLKPFSNKWLNYAVLISLALHLLLLYTPLAKAFDVVPLTLNNWLLILPFAVSGLIVFEIAKLVKGKIKTN